MFCAAPTVLIGSPTRREELRRRRAAGVRVFTAGAPPAAATIERIEGEFGWEITHVYGLTETAPFITICEPLPEHAQLVASERAAIKARQGVELITSGELRVVDEEGNEVPRDGHDLGRNLVRGNVVMAGYYNDPEATAQAIRGGWFHTGDAAVVHPGWLRRDSRPAQGRDHQRRREHLLGRSRGRAAAPSGGAGGRDRRAAARTMGRGAARFCCAQARRSARTRTSCASLRGPTSRISKRRIGSPFSKSFRKLPPAKFRNTF